MSARRFEVDSYVIYPTGYDEFINSDKDAWCLVVVNGHAWGWSVRRGRGTTGGAAMNRKGEWIYETSHSKSNRFRRYPCHEAINLAMKYVDTHRINRHTAAEASASVAARLAGSA